VERRKRKFEILNDKKITDDAIKPVVSVSQPGFLSKIAE
jgi:hypothetical protein